MKFARRAFPGKDGKIVAVKDRLNPDGDVKKTKYKLHWVADVPQVTSVVLRESAALRFRQSIEMVFIAFQSNFDLDSLIRKSVRARNLEFDENL